jgi:hypothetical protein
MHSFGFTATHYNVMYGQRDWPSRSYWMVPGTYYDQQDEP